MLKVSDNAKNYLLSKKLLILTAIFYSMAALFWILIAATLNGISTITILSLINGIFSIISIISLGILVTKVLNKIKRGNYFLLKINIEKSELSTMERNSKNSFLLFSSYVLLILLTITTIIGVTIEIFRMVYNSDNVVFPIGRLLAIIGFLASWNTIIILMVLIIFVEHKYNKIILKRMKTNHTIKFFELIDALGFPPEKKFRFSIYEYTHI